MSTAPPPASRTMLPATRAARGVVVAAALLMSLAAQAESVTLAGVLGSKALLVIDSGTPKSVAPGESYLGVRVISTAGDKAVIEQDGKRITLHMDDAPVSVGSKAGAAGRGTRIVLSESGGGHFITGGQINGRTVQFVVDTGATSVAMSSSDAERAGLNYKGGQPLMISTANGSVQGYKIKLASVRIGDVEVYDVDAVVTPQSMPYMLLGNSFLTRFQMKRENNLMTLDKRY